MIAPRYFVILGAMRTGSNLLEQIIAGLPGTVCFGEVFNPGFIGGPRRSELLGWTRGRRDSDPLGLLREMQDQAGGRLPGFRLFDRHSDMVRDRVLVDPACARIVLRRDPIHSFVSLKIAEKTGQWLLRNPRRRRQARVCFDATAFRQYRQRLERFYDRIASDMAKSGTTALEIDYDQLSDPRLPDRLARFLGRPAGRARPPTLVRQNPTALRSKVTNYARMCATLGRDPEPMTPGPLPGPGAFQLTTQAPLALAPVPGPGLLPLQALLHRIDGREDGVGLLGRRSLIARAAQGTLLARGTAEGRKAFAVLSRPDRRLKWLMGRVLFAEHEHPARLILCERHPDLPNRLEDWAALPCAERADVFTTFLDLVTEALADRADLPCPAAWRPQADLLEAMHWPRVEIRLLPESDFNGLAAAILHSANLAPFARGQCAAIARHAHPLPDEDPIPEALSVRAHALHLRDLAILGELSEGADGNPR